MAISKKGKRKIVFNARTFYYSVLPEFSGAGDMLSVSIASENKKFNVKYFVVQQAKETEYKIHIFGKEFPRLETVKSEIACPSFVPKEKKFVGPKDIESILKWCFKIDEK